MNRTIAGYDHGEFLTRRLSQEAGRKQKGLPTFWKLELDHLMTMKSEGDVLEVGVGVGVEADYLLSAGNYTHYTGLEPSVTLADYSEKVLSEKFGNTVTILRKTLGRFRIGKRFNVLVAITSLIHVRQIRPAIRKLHNCSNKDAVGMIVMKDFDEGVRIFTSEIGITTYYYPYKEFVQMLEEGGFKVRPESDIVEREGKRWQIYFVDNT